MPDFMFIMRGETEPPPSPEEMQQRMEAYMVWMRKMTSEGRMKVGQPLEPQGAHVKDAQTVITDGPFLEPREIIGGYVILSAANLEEATAIARDCPLLAHCEIMVRPIMQMETEPGGEGAQHG